MVSAADVAMTFVFFRSVSPNGSSITVTFGITSRRHTSEFSRRSRKIGARAAVFHHRRIAVACYLPESGCVRRICRGVVGIDEFIGEN